MQLRHPANGFERKLRKRGDPWTTFSTSTKFKADPEWTELLLTTPSALRVDNLGASGVEIRVMGDTKPMSRWGAMGELRKRLKRRFDAEGIEIPFPHTTLYFGNAMPEPGKPDVV